MDSTIKTQWVTALRSGDYIQGRKVLRQDDTYCCLGVLCDLHTKAHSGDLHYWRQVRDQESCYWNCYRYDGMTTALPSCVQDWAGLFSDDPDIVVYNADRKYSEYQHATLFTSLAQLNDEGHTFAQLAQLIEEQL